MKINQPFYIVSLFGFIGLNLLSAQINPLQKQQTTEFTNPIIWADAPDLSITRKGDDFFLISTTMHLMPGAPVMHSKDLVHWEMSSYVFDTLNDNSKYDLIDGSVYGRGQWASSIRYHKGKYYVLFSPNDEPFKSYFYVTDNPEKGNWKLITRTRHFHDASLLFDDDDRVYVFTSNKVFELSPDFKTIIGNQDGTEVFQKDASETGLLEGNQIIKKDGKYYMMMISWPRGEKRRQEVYRADKVTGPYEKKVILEDNFLGFSYAGQGALIDDKNGNWYSLIFQDRNGVGRVPILLPVKWENDWPILGDNGKVPLTGEVPLSPFKPKNHLVESDEFSDKKMKIQWQWNHNPVNTAWSLSERKGFLRLKTSRIVDNLYLAPNTLTQRMEGPKSSGIVALDVKGMKDGDVAGFSAFNGDSGILSVVMEDGKKFVVFSTNEVSLDNKTKSVIGVKKEEKKRIPLNSDKVYFKIDADFNLEKDLANFYYSTDQKNWAEMAKDYRMIFDYRRFFMGSKFAIFNYATKNLGGFVDVDFFRVNISSE
ncbi:glycoside hydrolase family 43 protein [Epilithonimonas hungarica]|uniref:Beta-xylosidase n=1 Tax=Epilithonimonas hungarica TaxID=454006 RepID=A0A1G7SMP9_9FLAO|nr:glycoside hydrolase 43 family protein [Epilithonimonas hungarica]SDG24211.1 Beta-xylosidase [Epilithonimonas hungarica]